MRPTNPSTALRAAYRLTNRSPRLATPSPILKPALTSIRHSSTSANTSSTNSSNNAPPSPSTVDATEVTHFNALASSWWDPHGPSRLLHLMNPLRHQFITRCRNTTPSSKTTNLRYLDIGCGGGIFAESAARLPTTKSVTAIDPTPEVLRIAMQHQRRDPRLMEPGRLTYLNTSIEKLPIPNTVAGQGAETVAAGTGATAAGAINTSTSTTSPAAEPYDIVSIFEVLEHVHAPGPFLTHVLPHVKPGGWLVMSTIARTWTSWLVTNVMAEDVLGIVPKGTHEWAKYVNEQELREWFAERGWMDSRTMGVMYVPGVGWREVGGSEGWGNYFFAVRRPMEE